MNRCRYSFRFLKWHLAHTIPMTMRHTSTYPELPRKSALHRFLDNLYIYFRDGAPCAAYDGLGLDVKGRRLDDFVSNHDWLKVLYLRLSSAGLGAATPMEKLIFDGASQCYLLSDKFCFWSFLDRHAIPVVPVLAHMVKGKLFDFTPEGRPMTSMSRIFVKPAAGLCGNSACLLAVRDGKFYQGDKQVELSDFSAPDQDWIFQPVIENHADLKALNPGTLNTMRIVTCRTKSGAIEPWDPGMVRIGRSNAVVDNFAKGGIGVGIGEDGKLERYGYSHDKELNYTKTEQHPDSHIVFAGRPIPFYNEAVALVKKAHGLFPSLQTIGWDVAITSDGPILLEGNQSWDIEMLQVVHHKGSAARFREIYGGKR